MSNKDNLARKEFHSQFNEYFKKSLDEIFFRFDVFVKEYDNKNEFNEQLFKKFNKFFHEYHLNHLSEILSECSIQKNYDADYEEENPESEYCSFNCSIRINELFDNIIKYNLRKNHHIDIYRLEDGQKAGLYNGRFAAKKIDFENQPNPYDDESFQSIFNKETQFKGNAYEKQWYFGFQKLEDVKNWLGQENHLDDLIKEGYVLNKITLPEDFVIQGYRQLIFKRSEALQEEIINLATLKNSLSKISLR